MAERFDNERFVNLLERLIDDTSKDVEKIKGRLDLLEYRFNEFVKAEAGKDKDRVKEKSSVRIIHVNNAWKLIFMMESAALAYLTWKFQK
jgi:hypothetical protein